MFKLFLDRAVKWQTTQYCKSQDTVCHFSRNIDNWNMMRRTLLLLCRRCNKCDITSLTSLPVNISILRNISDKKCTKPNFQYFSRKFKYQLTLALDHHTKCDHLHGYFLILFNVTFSGNISGECWVCYLFMVSIQRHRSALKDTWRDC